MYNKKLIYYQNCFGVLPSALSGKGLKYPYSFSNVSASNITLAGNMLHASYGLSGRGIEATEIPLQL